MDPVDLIRQLDLDIDLSLAPLPGAVPSVSRETLTSAWLRCRERCPR